MATVKAFRAIRPRADLAEEVASLPYDVFSREEAAAAVKDAPLSFLNIDRPETQFSPDTDMYSMPVYQKADAMLKEQREKGIWVQDDVPCFYLYELTDNGHVQTGFVGVSAVDDYIDGVCRKHEKTTAKKEQDRINHVDTLSAQTGPIYLMYRQTPALANLMQKNKQNEPIYDFILDGIRHRVWVVQADAEAIETAFQDVPSTYIADGHHRAASAVKVSLKRRQEHPNYTGEEEFNYFLSVLFPEDELHIYDYNRFVKDLNGMDRTQWLQRLKTVCTIAPLAKAEHPSCRHQMTMYMRDQWYRLDFREAVIEPFENDPVQSLDVDLLQNLILDPLLGIQDARNDERIEFVGGIRGLKELEKRVDQADQEATAFAMYPTDVKELLNVADANRLMPPKSTWFEPKLLSGLFIHEIER